MSKYIRANRSCDVLIYADGSRVQQIPIIGWDLSADPPIPYTPVGAFYPGQRFAVLYGLFTIVMPERFVTRSRADAESMLLGLNG